MNTNTNNTTSRKNAAVMQKAHAMTRETVREFPGTDYRTTNAAALHIAWNEGNAKTEWNALTGEQQNEYLQRMTYYEYGRRDSRTKKDGSPLPNVFTWVQANRLQDELTGIVNEAYIRVVTMLDDPRHAEKSLQRIISRAVIVAARYIQRQELRNASAATRKTDEEGNEYDAIDIYAGPNAPQPISPESAAILRDRIERAAADETDETIISGLAKENTITSIAKELELSQQAVSKRIKKIRERDAANN